MTRMDEIKGRLGSDSLAQWPWSLGLSMVDSEQVPARTFELFST